MKSELYNIDALGAEEKSTLESARGRVSDVAATIKGWMAERTLPLLHLPTDTSDLAAIQARANEIKTHAKRLVVLGTGGSSLGGQTLCSLTNNDFPVHFIDNVDPHSIAPFLEEDRLRECHFLLISKSGGTLETLAQSLVFLERMEGLHGTKDLSNYATAITMPGERALRGLAEAYSLPVMDHDPDVGGRFSVISVVGLLPAAVAGVDIEAVRRGAAKAMAALDTNPKEALDAACMEAALMESKPVSIMLPYCDRLKCFSAWYKQLWAESLGKSGKGSTPVDALGAVDHHSQLQLWMDGPRDKHFTIITADHDAGPAIPNPCFEGFDYLQGKTMSDVFYALQDGNIATMKRHGLPIRHISVPLVNEQVVGELLMQMMIETIATAQLIGVDAFDQPGVEESKNTARATLKDGVSAAA